MDEGRLEKFRELDVAVGDATVFQEGEKDGLLRGELVGDEPCSEVLVHPFLAGFHHDQAEGGADEVDDGADGGLVGVAEVFLVEVVLVFVEAAGEVVLLLIGEILAGFDFRDDRIAGLGGGDGFLPAGTVFVLVYTHVLGANLDVGDALPPVILAIQFDHFPAAGAGRCAG